MWAQEWDNIYDIVAPYPNAQKSNLTKILLDNGYTPTKMFKVAIK